MKVITAIAYISIAISYVFLAVMHVIEQVEFHSGKRANPNFGKSKVEPSLVRIEDDADRIQFETLKKEKSEKGSR